MSHFIRTQLVLHLFEELDLKRKEDISQKAHPSRIRKDKKHLSDILAELPPRSVFRSILTRQ